MPDIRMPVSLCKKRLEVKLRELALNVERMELRIMEIDNDRKVLQENYVATLEEIEKVKSEISEMKEE